MSKLNWKEWLGVGVVALVVAVVAFLGLLQVQHWRQDEETLHQVVQLLNYNVAQGKLMGVPAPQPAPPAVAPIPPKPEEAPKK